MGFRGLNQPRTVGVFWPESALLGEYGIQRRKQSKEQPRITRMNADKTKPKNQLAADERGRTRTTSARRFGS